MRILFAGRNYSQALKNNDPVNYLSVAESLGHEIVEKLSDNPDVFICVDYTRQSLAMLRQAQKTSLKKVLVCCEPFVVLPQNNQKRITKLFDKIVWVGRPFQPNLKWPQTWRDLEKSTERLDRVVLINSDKWSFIEGQLYWLRATIVSSEARLDTAGQGWKIGVLRRFSYRIFEFLRTFSSLSIPSLRGLRHALAVPTNYVGTPADKVRFMSKYKVALVIENSQEIVTEKLFDAWFAGCIPVYVGPNLKPYGLRDDLIIQCEPSEESVIDGIDRALATNYSAFQRDLEDYLKKPRLRETWNANSAIQAVIASCV